jgi:outer membrane lipoprotein-sorting protein
MRPLLISALVASSALADSTALDTWLKRQPSIQSLDVTFSQERKLPALKEAVRASGRLSFSKPSMVRWQLGEPPQTLAVSDGTTFTVIDTTEKTARKVPVNSPAAARFSMLTGDAFGSPDTFRNAFQIEAHQVSSGIHQYTLKPNDRRMRANVSWVFLDIDPTKNELRAMEIELKDRSRVRTIFNKPRFNVKFPAGFFQPDLQGYDVK